MRLVSVAVLTLSTIFCGMISAGTARAQGEAEGKKARATAGTKLPWNPFESVKEGEWESLLLKADAGKGRTPMQFLMTFTVAKAEGDVVSLKIEAQIPGLPQQDPKTRDYSRKETPTIEDFLSMKDEKVTDLKSVEEKKTVGGREFACTRLSYTTAKERALPNGTKMVMTKKVSVWISKDVKGSGLVAMSIEQSVTGGGSNVQSTTSEAEVVGFGARDAVDFGKKPGEIDLGGAKKPAEGETPKKP